MSHTGFWVSKSQIVGKASPRRAATASKADTHGDEPPPRRPPRPRRGAQAEGGEAADAARCGRFARERVRGEPRGIDLLPAREEAALERPGAPPPGNTAPAAVSVRPRCAVARGGIARAAVSEEDRVSFSSKQ